MYFNIPGGFVSHTLREKIIVFCAKYLYLLFSNDKWYMIKNYPTYQNKFKLQNNDYLICSLKDKIHNPLEYHNLKNRIEFINISHLEMINHLYKKNFSSNNNFIKLLVHQFHYFV